MSLKYLRFGRDLSLLFFYYCVRIYIWGKKTHFFCLDAQKSLNKQVKTSRGVPTWHDEMFAVGFIPFALPSIKTPNMSIKATSVIRQPHWLVTATPRNTHLKTSFVTLAICLSLGKVADLAHLLWQQKLHDLDRRDSCGACVSAFTADPQTGLPSSKLFERCNLSKGLLKSFSPHLADNTQQFSSGNTEMTQQSNA